MKKSIVMAVILLVIFGTLATMYTNNLSSKLYQETDEYLNDITIQTARAIKNRINENLTQLKTISLIFKQEGIQEDSVIDYLDQLAKRDGVKRYGIADLDGNTITSDRQSFNIADREYFQTSLKGENVTSDTMSDYTDGESINVYSVPIYNIEEKITGVLFATFYTEKYSNILSLASYNDVGYSFIFNKQGDVVISSKKADDFDTIDKLAGIELDEINKHQNGIIDFQDENDTVNYFIYATIENSDWIVASVFPQETVTKGFQEFIQSAFITWLLIGTGSALVIAFFYFKQGKNKLMITRLAYEDDVTNHYNYHCFLEYCQKINNLSNYVLVNCDIKAFKWFNEIYGEEIANGLLKKIMECIDNDCHSDEYCTRQSADHFALLLVKDSFEQLEKRLTKLAALIRNEFSKEYLTSPYYFHFGIYEILEDDADINLAFKKTQYAISDKKKLSKDDVTLYQEDVFQKELYDLQIEKEFQNGLNKGHFKAYIQPKVNLMTGKVTMGEILTRWHYLDERIISPGDFIPVYEKNGMLEALDFYILKKSLEKLVRWKKENHSNIVISINVSRTYIFNEGYLDKLKGLLESYDIDFQQIEIEITETTAFNHKDELIVILKQLKADRFRIALDDFGSGYSSLNMLKDLPIDVVKLDQEFFRTDDSTHDRSLIIVEEVIELCHRLNIEVVAEGVETSEQKDFLVSHHCDYIQGYYYYKPMMLDEFEELFVKNNNLL